MLKQVLVLIPVARATAAVPNGAALAARQRMICKAWTTAPTSLGALSLSATPAVD